MLIHRVYIAVTIKVICGESNPNNGNPLWSMDDLQRRQPTVPALVGTANIVVADKQGNIHWINTQTGKFVARSKGDSAGLFR